MKEAIARNLTELNKLTGEELVEGRYKKFRAMTRCIE
jgi:acetyl-CoA carboxylase alpha subunit